MLNGGNLVSFWEDFWLDNCSPVVSYPMLYDICHAQEWTFDRVSNCNFDNPFRRRFTTALTEQWEYIVNRTRKINIFVGPDSVVWSLMPIGRDEIFISLFGA